jgi:hypothetical protein
MKERLPLFINSLKGLLLVRIPGFTARHGDIA